jgi:hypothetical protein
VKIFDRPSIREVTDVAMSGIAVAVGTTTWPHAPKTSAIATSRDSRRPAIDQ